MNLRNRPKLSIKNIPTWKFSIDHKNLSTPKNSEYDWEALKHIAWKRKKLQSKSRKKLENNKKTKPSSRN